VSLERLRRAAVANQILLASLLFLPTRLLPSAMKHGTAIAKALQN